MKATTITAITPVSTEASALAPPRRESPEKMKPPNPGPRTQAAIAATPMTIWPETRMPARMTGQAIGSSTRTSVLSRLMPMPRADSMTVSGTPARPTTALRRIGSAA